MKLTIIILAILFNTSLFAATGFISESAVRACGEGEVISVFYEQGECEKSGEKCFMITHEQNCKDFDLIDGELIPNHDKKFARELAEKNRAEAEKEREETRNTRKARLKSLKKEDIHKLEDLKDIVFDLLQEL